jgi:hypothetical protein
MYMRAALRDQAAAANAHAAVALLTGLLRGFCRRSRKPRKSSSAAIGSRG